MRVSYCFLLLIAVGSVAAQSAGGRPSRLPRTLPALVSAEWLQANLALPRLVILDVRANDTFWAGHIPGAVHEPWVVPFSAWITMGANGTLLEMPADAQLFTALGKLGVSNNSLVVVVSQSNSGEPPAFGIAAATRVAMTIIYAGVVNVAVLDGGYATWVALGAPVATGAATPLPTPVTFTSRARPSAFLVSTRYVKNLRPNSALLDVRDVDVYFGLKAEPYAPVPGHIAGARSLPTPWLLSATDLKFLPAATLLAMVRGVVNDVSTSREVVLYCGVGGYASTAWFVLTQVLGYTNVKVYDGSAQLWVMTEPMVTYKWQ